MQQTMTPQFNSISILIISIELKYKHTDEVRVKNVGTNYNQGIVIIQNVRVSTHYRSRNFSLSCEFFTFEAKLTENS